MILSRKLAAAGLFCAFGFLSYAQTTQERIRTYFEKEEQSLGLTKADYRDFEIKNEHSSSQFDISYAYAHQQYQGVTIYNAIANFAFNSNEFRMTGNRFVSDIASRVNTTSASISKTDAIYKAAVELGITTSAEVDIQKTKDAQGKNVFVASEISSELIPVSLCYTLDGEDLKLAWDLSLLYGSNWWSVRVDATTGEIINQNDWMVSCTFGEVGTCNSHSHATAPEVASQVMMPAPPPSTDAYRVLEIPTESPNHGPDVLVTGPSDAIASPFGWHDDDGAAGEEYTITRGNNVYASEDTNDDNQPGYSPDGGATLNFDFVWNLQQSAQGFWDPAITNLFYMNNIMHDVFYHYGFDEAGGNFQENNYGNGGAQSDYVNADAQDGSGTNNANFGTPPDGSNPRMQMYIWTASGTPKIVQINAPTSIQGDYSGEVASFGPGLPLIPITGDFVLVDDGVGDGSDGCEPIINGAALNGNIAVIRRGNCSFVDKVVAAEAEGAIAVIIVNNTGGLMTMGGTDPGIGIPAVMVTALDGENFIDELDLGITVNGSLGDFGPFDRDSDLDNGVIAHEYGHGISNRLTGGPSAAGCLGNDEQMGEGWSDWCALITTIEPGDLATDGRGIGTYSDGQPINGQGIRPAPYSTNFQINSFTYASTNNASISQPHGIGFIWCTMLWDLTWALIDLHGFDNDIYYGVGGNNIAMHLIMNGMKLQACSPGFIDGRDAILAADQMLYNSQHQCLIWDVFAKRGLGFSADQGSSNDRSDQTAAFDLPPAIDNLTEATVSCEDYTWPVNGQTYTASGLYYTTITPTIGCDSIATLDLTINNTINSVVTYNGPTILESTVDNVNYQWIDCSNGNVAIPGETSQSFAPTQNGLYSVVAYQGNCRDTSVCLLVNQIANSGLGELNITGNILVSPNPTNGTFMVNLGGPTYSDIKANVINAMGQVVAEASFENTDEFEMSIETAPGVYFVNIVADGQTGIIKVIKE